MHVIQWKQQEQPWWSWKVNFCQYSIFSQFYLIISIFVIVRSLAEVCMSRFLTGADDLILWFCLLSTFLSPSLHYREAEPVIKAFWKQIRWSCCCVISIWLACIVLTSSPCQLWGLWYGPRPVMTRHYIVIIPGKDDTLCMSLEEWKRILHALMYSIELPRTPYNWRFQDFLALLGVQQMWGELFYSKEAFKECLLRSYLTFSPLINRTLYYSQSWKQKPDSHSWQWVEQRTLLVGLQRYAVLSRKCRRCWEQSLG